MGQARFPPRSGRRPAVASQRAQADRSQVVAAVADVASCGPDLRKDAGSSVLPPHPRQGLIRELNALPGRPALPGPIVSDLARAWRATINAENDYAAWAHDESAICCTPNDSLHGAMEPRRREVPPAATNGTSCRNSLVSQGEHPAEPDAGTSIHARRRSP